MKPGNLYKLSDLDLGDNLCPCSLAARNRISVKAVDDSDELGIGAHHPRKILYTKISPATQPCGCSSSPPSFPCPVPSLRAGAPGLWAAPVQQPPRFINTSNSKTCSLAHSERQTLSVFPVLQ